MRDLASFGAQKGPIGGKGPQEGPLGAGKTEIGPYLCSAAAPNPGDGTYPPIVGVDLPDGGIGSGRRGACCGVLESGTEIRERETKR